MLRLYFYYARREGIRSQQPNYHLDHEYCPGCCECTTRQFVTRLMLFIIFLSLGIGGLTASGFCRYEIGESPDEIAFITFIVCIIVLLFAILLSIYLCIGVKRYDTLSLCWYRNRNKLNHKKLVMELQKVENDDFEVINNDIEDDIDLNVIVEPMYYDSDKVERLKIGTYCYVDCNAVHGVICGYLPNDFYKIIDLFEEKERRAFKTSLTPITDENVLNIVQTKYENYIIQQSITT